MEKYLQIIFDKALYLEYRKSSYNSTIKTTQFKTGKGSE